MGDYKRVLYVAGEEGGAWGVVELEGRRGRDGRRYKERSKGLEVNSGRWALLGRSPSPPAEELSEGG